MQLSSRAPGSAGRAFPFSAALRCGLVALLGGAGCVGIFADDGSSASVGTHARGALVRPVALPVEGDGYAVHPAWRSRGRQYGTEEMARWLMAGFSAVARQFPESRGWLGDVSRPFGGSSKEHKSHESGRDVDVFFYAVDAAGRPIDPGPAMLRFSREGRAVAWSPADRRVRVRAPVPDARFDTRRNWALVRALLSDPTVEVQWIFIHRALGDMLLAEATAAGDDPALVARAAGLFHQPKDAQPHDDHMHIRVYCTPDDRQVGCVDVGPQRWWKKRWKYMSRVIPGGAESAPVIPGGAESAPQSTPAPAHALDGPGEGVSTIAPTGAADRAAGL